MNSLEEKLKYQLTVRHAIEQINCTEKNHNSCGWFQENWGKQTCIKKLYYMDKYMGERNFDIPQMTNLQWMRGMGLRVLASQSLAISNFNSLHRQIFIISVCKAKVSFTIYNLRRWGEHLQPVWWGHHTLFTRRRRVAPL